MLAMVLLSALISLVCSSGVLSEDSLLTPCYIQDTQCLSKSTQEFLEKTSNGIPKYDIKAIEPLVISSIDYELMENVKMHLRNITVMGLKNQKFSGIKMDTKTKLVNLQTKADINAESDLIIELGKGNKLSGRYSIEGRSYCNDVYRALARNYLIILLCLITGANSELVPIPTVLGTAKYGYDIKVDDNGIEHYEVGPETITCQAFGEPKVSLSSDLEKDKRDEFESKTAELRGKEICEIVKVAYITVVHNIRAAAKILPKSAFLKGV